MRPVKRPAMQVHDSNHVKPICDNTVNDCIRESVEIELPIVSMGRMPTCRRSQNAARGSLKIVKEIIPQTKLPLLVPQRCSLQLLVRLRMADDVH